MIKKSFRLATILVVAISFFAFRNQDKPLSVARSTVFKMAPVSDTGGRPVRIDSAQACIQRYATEMKKHGFTSQAGQTIDIHLTQSSQITTGQIFSGKQLQTWLNATAAAYAAAGKTLMINIQFGMYDMKYLNTYQPNAALRAASNNRVAVFLMPYDSAAGPGIQSMLSQPAGTVPTTGGSGTGGSGFDMGGLQP